MWASAVAVGFLVVPLLLRVSREFILLCAAILVAEAGSGSLGIRAACDSESPWAVDACLEEFHFWGSTLCATAFSQPGPIGDACIVETVGVSRE